MSDYGKYFIKSVLGQGSFGKVYQVISTVDNKKYAMKEVNLVRFNGEERNRALKEANLLKSIDHHNVLRYADSFENKGCLCIITEFCPNGDLYEFLDKQKISLEEDRLKEWFRQIAGALQYLHEKKIMHRDVKTKNVFLAETWCIKLGDMGFAKILESGTNTYCGTLAYMSPEIVFGEHYNYKSDIWALGVIVLEMATLKKPREIDAFKKVCDGKLPTMPTGYKAELSDILTEMFQKDPDRRPSADAILKHKYFSNAKPPDAFKKKDNKSKDPFSIRDLSSTLMKTEKRSDITEQSSGTHSLDAGEHVIPTMKHRQLKADSKAWKGIPVRTLDKLTDINEDLGPLQETDNHRVLFKTPFVYDDKKPPSPLPQYKDKWDAYHVRMPCSNQNEYPTQNKDGAPTVQRRWDMIQEALLGPIPGPYELEEKILSYNSRYYGKWNFDVLHRFFIEHIHDQEKTHFFGHTLKKMANLALQLPHLCTAPIPLLKSGRNFSITLSQQQIACLLANAFFCTFPRRNAKSAKSEFCRYPTINFNTLFMGQPSFVKFEKLKCIIHYFNRIFKKMPCGTVTFTRQCIDLLPDWDNDGTQLKGLHVSSEGTIEDDGYGMLQVDFANSFLGGGVLGNGCVQEEIRFLICPEMLVTRLFTECLGHNECLIMRGCERFSNYDGYASKFEWKQDYEDKTPRDSWGRIKCEVVAIDALQFYDFKSQFTQKMVKRELNKAYVGFTHLGKKTGQLPAVCTGNWGCGAFGGDKQLKALIQLMAAARAGRDLCYFTFDDEKLRDQIFEIHKFLTSEQLLSNGDLLKLIGQYRRNFIIKHKGRPELKLYDYMYRVYQDGFDEMDEDSNQSREVQRGLDEQGSDSNQSKVSCDQELEFGSEELEDGPTITTKGKKLEKHDTVDYKANTP